MKLIRKKRKYISWYSDKMVVMATFHTFEEKQGFKINFSFDGAVDWCLQHFTTHVPIVFLVTILYKYHGLKASGFSFVFISISKAFDKSDYHLSAYLMFLNPKFAKGGGGGISLHPITIIASIKKNLYLYHELYHLQIPVFRYI